MKSILLTILIASTSLFVNASDWIDLKKTDGNPEGVTLLSSAQNSSTIHFKLNGFWKDNVETSNGDAWVINTDGGASILKNGAPDLPLYATSMIIPNQARMEVRIISSQYEEFKDVMIAPSKGNLLRTIDPESVDYEFGKYYSNDDFYPGQLGKLRDPYIVRDFRGQTLLIQPMQYNPVTKTLRVYYDITIDVVETGISTINVLNTESSTIQTTFNNIYNHHFINYNGNNRYTPLEENGNMLIISYGDFMDEMEPFIDWKVKSGTPVEIIDIATIGGASDIKQFVSNYYNDNGLTYVLLIGDSQQVPSSTIGGVDSDVDYSYVVGDDHYPDLFVGRFSAETEAHVITQVQRVLDYEQTPIADTAWYTKAIGIASSEGTGDDGEYDYDHMRNIGDNKLIPFTYNYAHEFFDGNQGGNDATGNPNTTMVADAVNSGATIINYVGHGSTSAWSTSGFSSSNVSNLTNTGKLPFIFSVACVNGNFVNSYCFAEAWMRAEYNDQPSGAIATLMSTINQSWSPPMRGQDEMNDILAEAYTDNIKRTFGGISMNGCMNMNDVYGSAGDDMTDTWTIFGDPSLEIRTAIPQELTVTHPASLFLGATAMSITCDANGSLATLSMDGEILGSAIVDGGIAEITFDALSVIGTADFVVTSFNYLPYISTIDIVPAAGPFVVYAMNTINDISGNDDGLMDYSENILLTVGLANVGVDNAIGVTTTLTTTSDYIEIITNEADYGDIPAGDTIAITDAFAFNVANDIPDEIIAIFNIVAEDASGANIWESSFMITGHAPNLTFTTFVIDDSNGNDNGKVDPGESVDLVLNTSNTGSSEAYNVLSDLNTSSTYITINSDPQVIGNLASNESVEIIYNITAQGDTPDGTPVTFILDLLADHDITGQGEFFTIVGQKPVLILDLANSNSSDTMQACFTSLQVGNDLVTNWSDELDTYKSVFVLLGIYPNNYALSNAEGSLLKQYLENGGRVYMEGGDAWAFDPQTSGHELFHIDGVTDGSGDLGTIEGDDLGIMQGYSFDYDGNNNYIDHIMPKSGAYIIFSNQNPDYGTGVSYENDIYKTIGTSFEFSGLANGDGSTKDGAMAEILYFFGVDYMWTDINEEEINSNFDVVAFPNPTNGEVNIRFNLEENSRVELSILDLSGRLVYESSNESILSKGDHSFTWDSKTVDSGIYFYRLTIGNKSITKKIVVNK